VKKAWYVILLGVICGGSAVYLLPSGFQLADREVKMMKGELIPFKVDLEKEFELKLGSVTFVYDLNQLNYGINIRDIIDFGFDYPFSAKLKDETLLVSAETKTVEGEIITKIVDNQWVVNTNPVIASDRNYNSYAFEVIDSDQIPALQVKLEPQNQIYIGGLFHLPDNWTLLVTPEGMSYNPTVAEISEHNQTLFKYPSDQHLGEMKNDDIYVVRNSQIIIALGVISSILGLFLIPYGFWALEKGKILEKEKILKTKTQRRARKPKTVSKKKARKTHKSKPKKQ